MSKAARIATVVTVGHWLLFGLVLWRPLVAVAIISIAALGVITWCIWLLAYTWAEGGFVPPIYRSVVPIDRCLYYGKHSCAGCNGD